MFVLKLLHCRYHFKFIFIYLKTNAISCPFQSILFFINLFIFFFVNIFKSWRKKTQISVLYFTSSYLSFNFDRHVKDTYTYHYYTYHFPIKLYNELENCNIEPYESKNKAQFQYLSSPQCHVG